MLSVDNVITLIDKHEAYNWRIKTVQGDVLCHSTVNSPSDSITELRTSIGYFSALGRIKIQACDDKGVKQNWQNAFKWDVDLGGAVSTSTTPNTGVGAMAGMVTVSEMNARLEAERRSIEHTKEMLEMKAQIKEIKSGGMTGPWPFVVGKIMGMSPAEMQGLAGTDTNPTLEMKGDVDAPTEKDVKTLEVNLEKLTKKVSIKDINKLVAALVANPARAKQALDLLT